MTSFKQALALPTQPALILPAPLASPQLEVATTVKKVTDALAVKPSEWRLRDPRNLRLLKGLTLVRPFDIPRIEPCNAVPEMLIAFSEAMRKGTPPDTAAWVHFYENDAKFQRFWNKPEKFFPKLHEFGGMISPDYSTNSNLPVSEQITATQQNYLLGARYQADGGQTITNVRMCGPTSAPWSTAAAPIGGTIAMGLTGCIKDPENRKLVVEEIQYVCDALAPATLLLYGDVAYGVADYPLERGIAVYAYKPDSRNRSAARRLS